jgi:hypothetical protein
MKSRLRNRHHLFIRLDCIATHCAEASMIAFWSHPTESAMVREEDG